MQNFFMFSHVNFLTYNQDFGENFYHIKFKSTLLFFHQFFSISYHRYTDKNRYKYDLLNQFTKALFSHIWFLF